MSFRFSPLGVLYLLGVFAPNLLWTGRRPRGYDTFAPRENRFLLLTERVGQALVCLFVTVVPDRPGHGMVWLVLSLLLMALYEVWWVRYFRSPREMADFYASLLGVPVAGATLPVVAFLLLGVYQRNLPLLFSAVILGVGHIGIHLGHRREIAAKERV